MPERVNPVPNLRQPRTGNRGLPHGMKAEGVSVAAVGFTVKSGWASAVLLSGSAASPRVVDSRRIDLSDPTVPESRQPYHEGFGTARGRGPQLSRLIASVTRFGRRSVTELIRHYQHTGYRLQGTGIVVGSLIDPETVGSDHIRIHALEGQLFRGQSASAETNASERASSAAATSPVRTARNATSLP